MMKISKKTTRALAELPSLLQDYFSDIPDELLDVRRNQEAWTIREHLYHLVGVQEMLLGRMRLILTVEKPVVQPFFPENEPSIADLFPSIAKAFETYRTFRKKQLKLLAGCRKSDFKKQAVHPEYSQYSLPIIAHHMLYHEYWHMYRVEEIWLTKDEYFR